MTTLERQFDEFRKTRSEAVFRTVYRACTPRLYGFALRLAQGNQADASDIVQETWVRTLARIDVYDATADLGRWLNGIAVNCWRESCRRRGREVSHEPETIDATPASENPVRWLDGLALQEAVDSLPTGYHSVLVLHDVEGYTHDEIADLLGIAPGTSKSQLARARRALRAALSA